MFRYNTISPLSNLRCRVQVVMFDIQQRTTLGELSTPFIKYVVWSADMNHVALLSKHAIIIANKKLGNASTGQPCDTPCAIIASLTLSYARCCLAHIAAYSRLLATVSL